MSDHTGIRVGHVSALTWNKLKINYGQLRRDLVFNTDLSVSFRSLPAGVAHKKMTWDQGQAWIAGNAPAQEREYTVAGKFPIYHEQAFATGLGRELEDVLAGEGVRTDLLTIGEGVKLTAPLIWQIRFHDGNQAASSQILHVKENAEAEVILDYGSDKDAEGIAVLFTRVVLEKGARLKLAAVQTLGRSYIHLGDMGLSLAEGAGAEILAADFGAEDSYTGIQVEQIGAGASLNGRMAYMAVGNQTRDINYNSVLRGKGTSGSFTFDGVLRDQGRKAFRGTIDFRRGARGAFGSELENVLLLSPEVTNRTLPIILCEEEDVEGSHGASIGRLSEDMLFYMASRGIDEKTAERIMVRARLDTVIREIPDEKIRKRLRAFTEEAFSDESLS